MKSYKIYSGLGGSFGGATYSYTDEFPSEEEANTAAYEDAVGKYEQYSHLLRGFSDCMEEATSEIESRYENEYNENPEDFQSEIEEYADELYQEEVERWITYYVEEIDKTSN